MALQVTTLVVGQLEENCYILSDSQSRCIIIDPGDDADYIATQILAKELTPECIVATHGHFDHVQAANELKAAFSIPFLMHKKDVNILKSMRRSAIYFTSFDPGPPPTADFYIKEGSEVFCGKEKLSVFHTPGHTPGGISLYHSESNSLFVGDILFSDGTVGRTDQKYASKIMLNKSIRKILALPPGTIIYSGHGKTVSVREYKENYC
jgi:glyoxylase-like metal-dependent hydrolase (beta-lactamase superfamily II)